MKLTQKKADYLAHIIFMAQTDGDIHYANTSCKAESLLIEPIGNDDDSTKALINFMDTATPGSNPTLKEIQMNQQAVTLLFNAMAFYLTEEI